ncbi:MAG: aspartate--tRNA ligase [Pyrinomonadaceae bacterium]|nr:aspartate--tRNA ligase [Pyrinomonadaceae bacterium]
MIRTHKISQISVDTVNSDVTLGGWVNVIRHLGKLSFVELRDASGVIQLSFISEVTGNEAMNLVSELNPEAVIIVNGIVRLRPTPKNRNQTESALEIEVSTLEIVNNSESLPFEVVTDSPVQESLKIKHRWLYLRRARMQRNIELRSRAFQAIRQWFVSREFLEIETPILFKETFGGAREFIVPTRNHPGKFYVLRQSPQQLKQILMVGGFERYFQICKLFHDSYPRSRRQMEFTALDIEVAFATEADIMNLVEKMFKDIVTTVEPEFSVNQSNPVITYHESLTRFGTTAPDLRFAIELSEINIDKLSLPGFFEIESDPNVYLIRIPKRVAETCKDLALKSLLNGDFKEIARFSTDSASNEYKSADSFFNLFDSEWRCYLTEIQERDLVLMVTGKRDIINKAVAASRKEVAKNIDLKQWKHDWMFLWIIDQPLFKQDVASGKWKSRHQSFTAPKSVEEVFETEPDFERILGREYALVCNGQEMGGGSVRIHNADLQKQMFRLEGLNDSEIEYYFGQLLHALRSGAPPHAGATFSLDALVRMLAGESNISEIIAFPKLGNGIDPLTGAPTSINQRTLDAFHIENSAEDHNL